MRHEFSASVKNAARERAKGVCEASGAVYGKEPGTRCTVILRPGNYDYDHYPLPAHAEGSNTLDNCWCICKECHRWKTRFYDIPAEARIKRLKRRDGPPELRRKVKKIPKPANYKWPSRSFGK